MNVRITGFIPMLQFVGLSENMVVLTKLRGHTHLYGSSVLMKARDHLLKGLASFDRSLVPDLAPSGSNGQITISRISTLGSYLPEEAELIKDGGSRNFTSLPGATFFKRKDKTS
ncbi:hypothetical protein GQ457_10G009280 [Hibiscus cannabinus]